MELQSCSDSSTGQLFISDLGDLESFSGENFPVDVMVKDSDGLSIFTLFLGTPEIPF